MLSGIEDGEIPVWARPAVSQVEQMLAERGMSASTVARDSLVNTIIQAALPIAQVMLKQYKQVFHNKKLLKLKKLKQMLQDYNKQQ